MKIVYHGFDERFGVLAMDERGERMQAKIRDAQVQKTPYMFVVGDKDEAADTVSTRKRSGEDLKAKSLDEAVALLKSEL
ncbi:MAG: His/Gly/Thr/Pro-type tRNA ligase C-terminal domain-containing protein [Anaerolineales bacterium]